MKPVLQKSLAAIGGVAIVFIFFNWAFVGAGLLGPLFHFKLGLASEFSDGDAIYKKFGDVFSSLSVVGLALVAGLSFTVVFWERRPPQHRVQVIYWSLLLVIVPMSLLNFWSQDIFASRKQQALLDLVQCLLGCICLLNLAFLRIKSTEARVLRAFAVFFLAAQGIFVPGLFAVLWWLNWEGAITLATTRDLSPGWITVVSTVASLAISTMQYRLSAQRQQAEAQSAPLILRP